MKFVIFPTRLTLARYQHHARDLGGDAAPVLPARAVRNFVAVLRDDFVSALANLSRLFVTVLPVGSRTIAADGVAARAIRKCHWFDFHRAASGQGSEGNG